MQHKTFSQGEVIFAEGSYEEAMYEITSGNVGIYARYGTPEQTLLATLGSGETFGEMGLVEFRARSATAVALQDGTETDVVNADEFATYLKDQPDKVLDIMRQISVRLRKTNQKYEDACRTVYEAIEAERAGKRRDGGLLARIRGLVRQITGSAQ